MEWISVKDRLPAGGGKFLVKSEVGEHETVFHPKYGFKYDMDCQEYAAIVGLGVHGVCDKVTHWLSTTKN